MNTESELYGANLIKSDFISDLRNDSNTDLLEKRMWRIVFEITLR